MFEPQLIQEVWFTNHMDKFITEEMFSQVVQKMDRHPIEVCFLMNRLLREAGSAFANIVFEFFDADDIVLELLEYQGG